MSLPSFETFGWAFAGQERECEERKRDYAWSHSFSFILSLNMASTKPSSQRRSSEPGNHFFFFNHFSFFSLKRKREGKMMKKKDCWFSWAGSRLKEFSLSWSWKEKMNERTDGLSLKRRINRCWPSFGPFFFIFFLFMNEKRKNEIEKRNAFSIQHQLVLFSIFNHFSFLFIMKEKKRVIRCSGKSLAGLKAQRQRSPWQFLSFLSSINIKLIVKKKEKRIV